MTKNQIIGAICLAVGGVFLALAYKASNAPVEQLANTLTGHYSDQTVLYLVIGIIGVAGGLLTLVYRR
jgi:hypothetical protein